jgi:hypothetical protein
MERFIEILVEGRPKCNHRCLAPESAAASKLTRFLACPVHAISLAANAVAIEEAVVIASMVTRGGLAQERLELDEDLFDWIDLGRVFGSEDQRGAGPGREQQSKKRDNHLSADGRPSDAAAPGIALGSATDPWHGGRGLTWAGHAQVDTI